MISNETENQVTISNTLKYPTIILTRTKFSLDNLVRKGNYKEYILACIFFSNNSLPLNVILSTKNNYIKVSKWKQVRGKFYCWSQVLVGCPNLYQV